MKKMAVVYMAHDGFASLYSGVGTVARDFLYTFPKVSKSLQASHPDVELTLYAVTMKYNETSFALSNEVRDDTIQFVSEHANIHLVELHNGSAAQDAYGTLENWKNACISGATFLSLVATEYDSILAICVDTPFVQVANRFIDTYDLANVRFIWLPQSTVRIHGYGMSSDADQQGIAYADQRYVWEKGVIDLAKQDNRVRIGCVGEYVRRHLVKEYDALPASLIDVTNSLYLERLQKNVHSQTEIQKFLEKHDIPTNRPILFSFGRAEPYKGLDLILKNCDEVIDKHNYFILIFAAPYSMDDPYVKELIRQGERRPNDIKVICGLDFTAPHYVMQWLNTKIVAILSRAEPFGLIPIESRFYNNPQLTLLVSDKDGLSFQIDEGRDGYLTDLSADSIREKFSLVACIDNKKKKEISQNGYNKVIEHYDQINVNINVLEQYVF